jgi:hypothetical protein
MTVRCAVEICSIEINNCTGPEALMGSAVAAYLQAAISFANAFADQLLDVAIAKITHHPPCHRR